MLFRAELYFSRKACENFCGLGNRGELNRFDFEDALSLEAGGLAVEHALRSLQNWDNLDLVLVSFYDVAKLFFDDFNSLTSVSIVIPYTFILPTALTSVSNIWSSDVLTSLSYSRVFAI